MLDHETLDDLLDTSGGELPDGTAMDGERFDRFTRALATSTTRRGIIKILVAGLTATIGRAPVAAACINYGRTCSSAPDCCSGNCVGGKCACAVNKTRCGTRCVDLRYDEGNCGACGVVCADGLSCRSGICTCSNYGATCTTGDTCCSKNCVNGRCDCPTGRKRCGTRCVNTGTDEANCGACGNVCPSFQICKGGACVDCPAGQIGIDGQCVACVPLGGTLPFACSADSLDYCCRDAQHQSACTDRDGIGICCASRGAACAGDTDCCLWPADVCYQGACQSAPLGDCPPGTYPCGEECVADFGSNPGRCGGCDVVCDPNTICCNGNCCQVGEVCASCGCVASAQDCVVDD